MQITPPSVRAILSKYKMGDRFWSESLNQMRTKALQDGIDEDVTPKPLANA